MKYTVQELLAEDHGRWDRRIAADLAAELETQLGDKATIPAIRQMLAVKGYRELRQRLELEAWNKKGEAAVRAMAMAMRAFAPSAPGYLQRRSEARRLTPSNGASRANASAD